MRDIQDWLDKGQALAGQATEGPWEASGEYYAGPDDTLFISPKEGGGVIAYVQPDWADAEFIADARIRLPKALAVIQSVLEIHQDHVGTNDEGSCPTVQAIWDAIGGKQ